jgi:hypothetical protein
VLPLIAWTTVRLVVFQKNDGRRHNSEMEPQGRTIASPFHTRRRSKTFRLGKTTLRVRVHVQAVGLNAETKNRPASSRGGDFSLDIPFYRTSAVSSLINQGIVPSSISACFAEGHQRVIVFAIQHAVGGRFTLSL